MEDCEYIGLRAWELGRYGVVFRFWARAMYDVDKFELQGFDFKVCRI